MDSRSSLIGFGLGALLAGGVTYVALNREPAPAPAPTAQTAPLVESSSNVIPSAPAMEAPEAPAPAPVSGFTKVRPKPAKSQLASSKTAATPAVPAPASAPPVALTEPPRVTPQPDPPAPAAAKPTPEPAVAKTPPPPPPPNQVTIPAGTNIAVRLNEQLASDTVQQGHAFRATLDQPLVVGEFVIAERGARVDGRVMEVEDSGRVKGRASLNLELTHIRTSDGQRVAIRTSNFSQEADKGTKSDATKVAVGAGVGAALGAIFGGGKGAAIGSAAGAGAGAGTVLATKGKPVVLPAETRMTFALRAPVTVTEKR